MGLMGDLRYAIRALRASRGFTIASVLTMAIGVGATSGIFSIVNAALLRPLPFPDSDRLIALGEYRRDAPKPFRTASLEALRDWQEQSRTIEAFTGWRDWGMSRYDGDKKGVYAAIVTPDFFRVFPARPVLGRLFRTEDDRPGSNRLIVLTESYWRTRWGADRAIVGKTMDLERGDRAIYTIIGVVPRQFEEMTSFEGIKIFALSSIDEDAATGRARRNRQVFARLGKGVSIGQARSEMNVIGARLERQYPDTNRGWATSVEPLVDREVGPMANTVRAFFIAVGLILLIACANVAALQLARVLVRRREFSIRKALGAGRMAVVRAVIVEGGVLSVVGGVAGLLGSRWLVQVVLKTGPAIPRAEGVHFDSSVFLFAFAMSAGAALMLALPGALLIARMDPVHALKEESGQAANSPAQRMRMVFVGGQIALALMLLTGAVAAAETLVAQLTIRPGFDPSGLAWVHVFPPMDKYKKPEQVTGLYRQLIEESRSVPGVVSASAASAVPTCGEGDGAIEFSVEGETVSTGMPMSANYFNAAPGYFKTLGVQTRRGRDFDDGDTKSAPAVAIVNEAFVHRYVPDESDPLKVRIRIKRTGAVVAIVGVVGDFLQQLKPRAVAEPEIYWPYSQSPRWATFLVTRSNAPQAALAAIARRVHAIDPDVHASDPQVVADRIARSGRGPRFLLLLLGLFAGVAALLGATGVYGLVSYTFAQRTREIGVRVALGASSGQILRLVAGSGLAAVAAGSAIGLLGTLALTRVISASLLQIEPVKAGAAFIAWALLVLLGCLASYLPARRALRTNPVNALRSP